VMWQGTNISEDHAEVEGDTTRRYNAEDDEMNLHHRENLKSRKKLFSSSI